MMTKVAARSVEPIVVSSGSANDQKTATFAKHNGFTINRMFHNNNNNNNEDEGADVEVDGDAAAGTTAEDDDDDDDDQCHSKSPEEITNQVAAAVAAADTVQQPDSDTKTTNALNDRIALTDTATVTTSGWTAATAGRTITNTSRKMFECDICNMRFSNGANMRRHRMRHSGVKPYECRICQKRFFRKDHLAEHFTTHTKTLPYHCPICDRGFQRQIAMRAHFQNEHVGQHDLVKSCPLCSYRASSMKSLRVHFHNRHGVDLDNPGPSSAILVNAAKQMSASSLIESLISENSNSSSNNNLNCNNNGNGSVTSNISTTNGGSLSVTLTSSVQDSRSYSDSGESTGTRSVDNLTPPMHFLTPQVEISMASDLESPKHSDNDKEQRSKNDGASSPYSKHMIQDLENNNTTSNNNNNNSTNNNNIIPSISLIPIKQEVVHSDDSYDPPTSVYNSISTTVIAASTTVTTGTTITTTTPLKRTSSTPAVSISPLLPSTSNSLSSLIKVSPLKSLLKDELKRKSLSITSVTNCNTTTSNSNPSRAANIFSGGGTVGQMGNQTMIVWPNHSKNDSLQQPPLLTEMKCVFCGIYFPDQTLYFLHIGCHSDLNPWKCNICGDQCSNIYEFNSHLLSKSH